MTRLEYRLGEMKARPNSDTARDLSRLDLWAKGAAVVVTAILGTAITAAMLWASIRIN